MTVKKLIRGGAIIVTGSLVGSIASYFNNTLTGRLLGPELYGGFTSLISLLAIVSVPTMAIQTIAAKSSADYLANDRIGKVKKLLLVFHKRLWPIGLVIALSVGLISPLAARFLKIESLTPIVILAIIFLPAFLIPITRGIIQGTQQFFQLSLSTSIEAISRLAIGIGLIILGFSLNGAIAGVVAGSVIAYFLSFLPIRKIFSAQVESVDKKNLVAYSIPTVIVILCLTALVNADIILAKHFLSPVDASYYAALSTIAKIIFYFSGPIVGVMFPMIADLFARGEKHFHLLLTTFFAVFGSSLAILVVFMIAPRFVINTLYGTRFIEVWPYLASMGLVMLIYGLVNLMANYFLSIGQMKFVPYLIFFTLLEIILIVLIHSSIGQLVIILMLVQICLLLVLLTLYFLNKWPIILEKIKKEP